MTLFSSPGAPPTAFRAPDRPVAPASPLFSSPGHPPPAFRSPATPAAGGGPAPTGEQALIVDAYRAGNQLVINAGAGTGKTSTLRMCAVATPGRRAVYISYNKAIAADAAASFPPWVDCRTAHSLAFRAVGARYRHRLEGPRLPAKETARMLGLRSTVVAGKVLGPAAQARIVTATVGRFCASRNLLVEEEHVVAPMGVDGPDAHAALVDLILPAARAAWDDIADPGGRLRFVHDHYLKLWQLSGPRLAVDVVLLDEAQDANPVIADIVNSQRHAQRVLVGDRAQAIYGWRGAVDAMESFIGRRLQLSQSWRFGQRIADEANRWLTLIDTPLRLTGNPGINSRIAVVGLADVVLCRTNAGAVRAVMSLAEQGRKVALVGGGDDARRLADAAITLRQGAGCDHPELFLFRTWRELREHVEQDSSASDLKVFVDLVDTYGPESIIRTVDQLVGEDQADVAVSTVHKAKGREWNAVRIASDFRGPDQPGGLEPGELMLAYVAVTRARQYLDRGSLDWIDDVTGGASC